MAFPFLARSMRARCGAVSKRSRRSQRDVLPLERLEDRALLSIQFVFDYSLDTSRFFTAERKAVLQKAAVLLTSRISDTLSAISPSGSNTWSARFTNPGTGRSHTIRDLRIATDEIRVYVGARNLPGGTLAIASAGYSSFGSSAWNDQVRGRGQSGVKSGTDYAPWGGSITFDSSGVRWHSGLTTSGLGSNESDLLSVAQHELGHILGISSGTASWRRWISNGRFNGPNVKSVNRGSGVKVDPGLGHLGEGVTSLGIEAGMDPTLNDGTRKLFGRVDFAALQDIGWRVGTSNDTVNRANHQMTYRTSGSSTKASISGTIDNTKDVDLYRVYIEAGGKLTVTVSAARSGTKIDTYLRLFDLTGKELFKADQGGVGKQDKFTVRVNRSDYYFIGVSSYANRSYRATQGLSGPGGPTGTYSLLIQAQKA